MPKAKPMIEHNGVIYHSLIETAKKFEYSIWHLRDRAAGYQKPGRKTAYKGVPALRHGGRWYFNWEELAPYLTPQHNSQERQLNDPTYKYASDI